MPSADIYYTILQGVCHGNYRLRYIRQNQKIHNLYDSSVRSETGTTEH